MLAVASRKTPKIGQSDRHFETSRGKEDKRAKLRASVFMETSWGKAANGCGFLGRKHAEPPPKYGTLNHTTLGTREKSPVALTISSLVKERFSL
jgi:hypothetical protein